MILISFFNVNSFEELVNQVNTDNENFVSKDLDYVLLEIPSIINHTYSPELIRDADIAIMVARANRTWQASDIHGLEIFSEFLKEKALVILNGVNPEFLQDLIGELPRKRSRLRRVLKKAIRLQFFERYQIRK